jgi:hypothetical protein
VLDSGGIPAARTGTLAFGALSFLHFAPSGTKRAAKSHGEHLHNGGLYQLNTFCRSFNARKRNSLRVLRVIEVARLMRLVLFGALLVRPRNAVARYVVREQRRCSLPRRRAVAASVLKVDAEVRTRKRFAFEEKILALADVVPHRSQINRRELTAPLRGSDADQVGVSAPR